MNDENKALTVSGYRNLDVFIFTLLACMAELVNLIVFKKYFSEQLFTLSIVVPMTLLVMQRWNWWSVFVAVFAGLAYCVGNGAQWSQYLVYMGGNCFILINLLWYRFIPKKKLIDSGFLRICFAFTGFVLANVGRTLIALFFEGSFIENIQRFLIADGLNIAIGFVIIWIAGKQKDLFKDQMEYLIELQEERERNKLSSLTGGNHEGRSIEETGSQRTDNEG